MKKKFGFFRRIYVITVFVFCCLFSIQAFSGSMPDDVEGTFYRVGKYEDDFGYRLFKWSGSIWDLKIEGAIRVDVDARGVAWIIQQDGNVFEIQTDGSWIYRGKPGPDSHKVVDIGAGREPCMPLDDFSNKGVFVLTEDSSNKGHLYKWDPGIDDNFDRWTLVKEAEKALSPRGTAYNLRLAVHINGNDTFEDAGLPVFTNHNGEVYALRPTEDFRTVKLHKYTVLGKVFDFALSEDFGIIYSLRDGGSRDNVYVQRWDTNDANPVKVSEPLYDHGGYSDYPARNLAIDANGVLWVSETDEGWGNYMYWHAGNDGWDWWFEVDSDYLARDISIGPR